MRKDEGRKMKAQPTSVLARIGGAIRSIVGRTSGGAAVPAVYPKIRAEEIELQRTQRYQTDTKIVSRIDEDPGTLIKIFNAAADRIHEQVELGAAMEEYDDHIRGTMELRRAAVSGMEINVRAGDEDDAASVAAADIAREMVGEAWFTSAVDYLMGAVLAQHAAVELLWGRRHVKAAGRELLMVSSIRTVEPGRWYIGDEGEPRAYRNLVSRTPAATLPMIAGKYLLHHHAVNSTPGSMSMARTISKLFVARRINRLARMIQTERWGVPWVDFTYRAGMTEQEISDVVDAMYALALQKFIAHPEGTTTTVHDAPDRSPHIEDNDDLCRAISRLLLGQDSSQMAQPGQKTGATLAGSVRDDIRDRDAKAIDASINECLLVPWCMWNFGADIAPPRIERTPKKASDPPARGAVYKIAQEIGLPCKREQAYRDLDLEEPAEGDETIFGAALPNAEGRMQNAEVGPGQSDSTTTGPVDNSAPPPRKEPLSGIQITSAMSVLERIAAGTLTAEPGRELLIALGFEEDRAGRMVQATKVSKDSGENTVVFAREIIRLLLADGTINDVLYNVMGITEILDLANVPIDPDYTLPWMPVITQPGLEVTGNPTADSTGAVVGSQVKPTPALPQQGGFGVQGFKARAADPTSDTIVARASAVFGDIFQQHSKAIRSLAESIAAKGGSDAEQFAELQRRLPEILGEVDDPKRRELLAKGQRAALARGALEGTVKK